MSDFLVAKKRYSLINTPKPIEYIEWKGDGNQSYIDTGIKIDDNDYVLTCEFISTSATQTAWARFFGSYTSETAAATRVIVNSTAGYQLYVGYRHAAGAQYKVTTNVANTRRKYVLSYKSLKIYNTDGSLAYSYTLTNPSGTTDNSNVAIGNPNIKMRVYGFSITHNDDLLIDLIPYNDGNADCMYDRVSKKLFYMSNYNKKGGVKGNLLAYNYRKSVVELPYDSESNLNIIKRTFAYNTTVNFDSQGGSQCDSIQVPIAKNIDESLLPVPTISDGNPETRVFCGWFTGENGTGTRARDIVPVYNTPITLYAWWSVWSDSYNCTSYKVVTTTNYNKTGIYRADIIDENTPIYIDWGDGTTQSESASLSELTHSYENEGSYIVKVSDNILTFVPSCSVEEWATTTSQNKYTFYDIITSGEHCLGQEVCALTASPITYSFAYLEQISSLDFYNSCFPNMSRIGGNGFRGCFGLKDINGIKRMNNLPSFSFISCDNISGSYDFSDCQWYEFYGVSQFQYCSKLEGFKFPRYMPVPTAMSCTFQNCSALTSITLPDCVSTLQHQFCSNTKITDLFIPKSVMSLSGNWTFGNNPKLSSVIFEEGSQLSIINGLSAFCNDTALTSINIPNTVRSIGSSAFRNTGLYSLTLPSALSSVGTDCFRYNTNLTSIDFTTAPNLLALQNQALWECTKISSLDFSNSNKLSAFGTYVFNRCSALTSFTTPAYLKLMNNAVFQQCRNLSTFTNLSTNSISGLSTNCFGSCVNLTSMTFLQPKSPVTHISCFGSNTSNADAQYTGLSGKTSGNNVLNIYNDSVGYNVGAWSATLLNSSRCNFHVNYLDPFDGDHSYDAECEYLYFNGHQWINSMVSATNYTDLEMDFTYLTPTSTSVATSYDDNGFNGYYFGSLDGGSITATSAHLYLRSASSAVASYRQVAGFNKMYSSYSYNFENNHDYTVTLSSGNMVINDGTTDTSILTGGDIATAFTTKLPMAIGGLLYETVYKVYTSTMRLKSFKIWDRSTSPSTLVRDFIPVRRGTTGYLYDRVAGRLHRNLGNGKFGYGGGYQFSYINYLESTGTQGIILPYVFQATDKVTIKVQRTKKETTTFIGAFVSNTTSYRFRLAQEQTDGTTRFVFNQYTQAAQYSSYFGDSDDTLLAETILTLDFPNKKFGISSTPLTEEKTIGLSSVTGNASVNTALFGVTNQTGAWLYRYSCRIFSCKIERSGEVLYDLVPVKVTLDNGDITGALYDKNTHVFYFNDGTGEFVLGNDIT